MKSCEELFKQDFYNEIIDDFNFSVSKDRESAGILNDLLEGTAEAVHAPLDVLEEKIKDKRVNIFGGGPSLERVEDEHFKKGTNISANGATSFLIGRGVIPDIIVTDLDGKIDDLLKANKMGSIVVLHAHGDNIQAIKRYAAKFNNVIGTTQLPPFGKLHNFGGFTDGDRAVYLAEHFKPEKIVLYGMDLDTDEIGRYSFTKDIKIKRKKLGWARKLIDHLKEVSEVEILNMTEY